MRNSRSKKLVVDPVVRAVFIRHFLLCWVCCTLFAALLLAAIYTLAEPDQRAIHHLGAVLARHWPILAVSVAMLPIIVWDAVRFSRRVAGPVCQVRRSLNRRAKGEEIRPLHFRGNALWKDLGDQINVLLNRLQEVEAKVAAAERTSKSGDRVVVHNQQKRDARKQYGTRRRRHTVSRGLFRVLTPPTEASSPERTCS